MDSIGMGASSLLAGAGKRFYASFWGVNIPMTKKIGRPVAKLISNGSTVISAGSDYVGGREGSNSEFDFYTNVYSSSGGLPLY